MKLLLLMATLLLLRLYLLWVMGGRPHHDTTHIHPSKDDLPWTGVPGGDGVLARLALLQAPRSGPVWAGGGAGEDVQLDILIG